MHAAGLILNTSVASAKARNYGIMWNDVMHKTGRIIDIRRGASNGSQSETVVKMRGECTGQCTSSCCISLVRSVLIHRSNWINSNPPIKFYTVEHTHTPPHKHTHRRAASRHTGNHCVSEPFSRLIINNAWLWEDERLFWLKACFSYGETSAVAVLTVHSLTKWVFLHMSTPNWSSPIKSELIQTKMFELREPFIWGVDSCNL